MGALPPAPLLEALVEVVVEVEDELDEPPLAVFDDVPVLPELLAVVALFEPPPAPRALRVEPAAHAVKAASAAPAAA